MRYSASNVGMTLKSGLEVLKVIEILEMVPIDRSYTTLYWSAVVTVALSRTIFELLDVQNIVTLKPRGH